MNKKLGIGIAAAAITSGLVYLYKRKGLKKESPAPQMARTRHRTDAFAKAKQPQDAL